MPPFPPDVPPPPSVREARQCGIVLPSSADGVDSAAVIPSMFTLAMFFDARVNVEPKPRVRFNN